MNEFINLPLHLQPSRAGAVVGLIVAAVLTVVAVFQIPVLIAILADSEGWFVIIAMSLVVLFLGGAAVVACLRRIFMQGPAIIVDKTGITDRRGKRLVFYWEQLESVKLDLVDGAYIMIRVRKESRPHFKVSALGSFARRFFRRGDREINLSGVSYHPTKLEKAIEAHMSRAASRRSERAAEATTGGHAPVESGNVGA